MYGWTGPGWTNWSRDGWEEASKQGCEAYLGLQETPGALAGNATAAGDVQPPRYCDEFHGVECCSSGSSGSSSSSRVSLSNRKAGTGAAEAAAAAAAGADDNSTTNGTDSTCLYEHELTAVALRANHMNGSLQDAALMEAIFNLEACGLEVREQAAAIQALHPLACWTAVYALAALLYTGSCSLIACELEMGEQVAALQVLQLVSLTAPCYLVTLVHIICRWLVGLAGGCTVGCFVSSS
jgi:hypothetical protein